LPLLKFQLSYLNIKPTLGFVYKLNTLAGRNNVSKESVSLFHFMGPTLCFSETILGVRIRHWIPSTSDFHVLFQNQSTKSINI